MAEKKKVDYNPVTAQVALAVDHKTELDRQSRELAEEAGVTHAAHVDYEEALKNYESRDDVETLANRRAREGAADLGDQAFARTNDPSGVVTAESADAKDVKESEQYHRDQAKATADRTAEVNEPVATIENEDEGDEKKSRKSNK